MIILSGDEDLSLFSKSDLTSSKALESTSNPKIWQILSSSPPKSSNLPHLLQQYPPNSSLVTSASI
jgi:hypothetical protein